MKLTLKDYLKTKAIGNITIWQLYLLVVAGLFIQGLISGWGLGTTIKWTIITAITQIAFLYIADKVDLWKKSRKK